MKLISSIDCLLVIIESDRQVKFFLTYVRGKTSTRLCVSTSPISGSNGNIGVDNDKSNSPFREQGEHTSFPPRDDTVSSYESVKNGVLKISSPKEVIGVVKAEGSSDCLS